MEDEKSGLTVYENVQHAISKNEDLSDDELLEKVIEQVNYLKTDLSSSKKFDILLTLAAKKLEKQWEEELDKLYETCSNLNLPPVKPSKKFKKKMKKLFEQFEDGKNN